jgi:hypothetical protein
LGIGTTSPTQKLDVNGVVTTTPGLGSSGAFALGYGSNAASRSWRMRIDDSAFGDFSIQQTTTQTGSTYSTKLNIDASGNLGLGVTPSTGWNTANNRAIEVFSYGSISSNNSQGTCDVAYNCYNSTAQATLGWKYRVSTALASLYQQLNGIHAWHIAPAGTADAGVTFTQAMTLDTSGRLVIGATTSGAATGVMQTISSSSSAYTQYNKGTSGGGVVGTEGTGLVFYTYTGSLGSETYSLRATIDSSGNLSTVGSVTGVGLVSTVNGTQLTLQRTGPSAINTMSCGGSGELAMVNSSANAIVLYNTFAHFPSAPTTASAANAFIDNSSAGYANQLLRSTSSAKYKTDVEDLQTDFSKKIYDLRTVWYRSAADADRKDWSWYGLIAEEVAAIEPRLVHWTYADDQYEYVSADIEGSDQQRRALKSDAVKTPDGIQYDRIGVLLLKEMQSLKAIIDTQALTITTLTARITALESA